MRIDILTLFPEMFDNVLNCSMLRIAQEKGLVQFHVHNIRDYSEDKHMCVDDRPYGGGPGMVLKPEPVFNTVEAVEKVIANSNHPGSNQASDKGSGKTTRILLTPQGIRFNQDIARELARNNRLMLICGHYEGFDERIRIGLDVLEISIGDYILSGGEVPAMVIIDSVVRLTPDVLGDNESPKSESFENGLLEYPQYTRPMEFRGMRVPETLISGNHKKIKEWQYRHSVKRTTERRPDIIRLTFDD